MIRRKQIAQKIEESSIQENIAIAIPNKAYKNAGMYRRTIIKAIKNEKGDIEFFLKEKGIVVKKLSLTNVSLLFSGWYKEDKPFDNMENKEFMQIFLKEVKKDMTNGYT